MEVLIIGSSGSGKTYLSKRFKEFGVNAFDADEIDGLHGWYNWKKEKVHFPHDAGKEFLDNHNFLWSREFLEDFLSKNSKVYLFGNSGNVDQMADLFDKVYYLRVPDNIILERLDHPSRENPMGKTDYQKKEVLKWNHENRQDAERIGAQFVDGTLTAEEIYELIK